MSSSSDDFNQLKGKGGRFLGRDKNGKSVRNECCKWHSWPALGATPSRWVAPSNWDKESPRGNKVIKETKWPSTHPISRAKNREEEEANDGCGRGVTAEKMDGTDTFRSCSHKGKVYGSLVRRGHCGLFKNEVPSFPDRFEKGEHLAVCPPDALHGKMFRGTEEGVTFWGRRIKLVPCH